MHFNTCYTRSQIFIFLSIQVRVGKNPRCDPWRAPILTPTGRPGPQTTSEHTTKTQTKPSSIVLFIRSVRVGLGRVVIDIVVRVALITDILLR